MTDGRMTWEVFNEHRDDIHLQVRTILAAKGMSRQRFRITALYERGSNNLVAEVLRTTFGPVVVSAGSEPGSTEFVNGKILAFFRRTSEYHNVIPWTDDDGQFFQIRSSTAWYTLRGVHIRERRSPAEALVYR